jgi:putative tricarboxylic transport membrane protein
VAGLICIATVGAFSINRNFFDVGILLVLGSFAYFLVKAKYPIPPLVLGLVLGELLESETRTALRMHSNDWMVFFTRPVPCVLIIFSVSFFVYALYKPAITRLFKKVFKR